MTRSTVQLWVWPILAMGFRAALLAESAESIGEDGARNSILLPACALDRGNVRTVVSESWADFPISAQYTLHVCYAAAEVRPVDVYLDMQADRPRVTDDEAPYRFR